MQNSNCTCILPKGSKAAIVPVECLARIQEDLDALRRGEQNSGLIDAIVRDFYDFNMLDSRFPVRSIVVAAVPTPIVKVRFRWERKEYVCYTDGWKGAALSQDAVYAALIENFGKAKYHIVRYDALPQKQLSVRSGLAEYGRNNLTYVQGMGSFQQIMTLLTDMPCDTPPLMDIRRMRVCEHCMSCVRSCPTQAIDGARKLIRAERCLTYFNEFIDLAPFPDWIPASAHHSLHGCMHCQINCPRNAYHIKGAIEPISFDEAEVSSLLEGRDICGLSADLSQKIRTLGLEDYLPLLPRNMAAIIRAQDA